MEWIRAMENMLDYIEAHLTEPVSVRQAADAACYSPFALERTFAILTDMTLAEYIRQRKLSVAGQELQAAGAKVIDVALKYGYETPESFEKAFRRFHGVTPSAARRSRAQLRYRNPMKLKVTLEGEKLMDYRIEDVGMLYVMGKGRKFSAENSYREVPKFWTEYYQSGWDKAVPGYLGLCLDDAGHETFTYVIGRFCEPDERVPQGFEMFPLPAHTWVKFRCVGPIPSALQSLNSRIFSEWLPNNQAYDMAQDCNLEIYSEGDMSADDYVSEIWLPVVKK